MERKTRVSNSKYPVIIDSPSDDNDGDRTSLIPTCQSIDLDDSLDDDSDGWPLGHDQQLVTPSTVSESFSWARLFVFMGPGFLVSTSFLDPGNFDTDIQAGARFEYGLVWVLICATMLGLLLQNLAARLGVVTGLNLAEICALEYPGRLRYILWVLAEVTIIASDIPEVIGTAFALRFLFNCPLWLGVIITSVSVMLFLFINLFGVRRLELAIGAMIGVVLVCFLGELTMSSVSLPKLVAGVVPSFSLAAMYTATSLIGSVVMPHNIFLHSALVKTRSIRRTLPALNEACFYNLIESCIALGLSLLINIAILALSAASFYPNASAGLQSAPALLQKVLAGGWAPTLFAIALLASGQSSTMTGTYAGQFVMEGFLQLRMRKWTRAIMTRSLAIVPSLIIALIAGDQGADQLIILSQVVLSLLLPFSLVPLVKLTSCADKMGAFVNPASMKLVVSALGCVVVFANLTLVAAEVFPMIGILDGVGALVGVLVLVATATAYMALLVYLLVVPISTTHSSLDIKPA